MSFFGGLVSKDLDFFKVLGLRLYPPLQLEADEPQPQNNRSIEGGPGPQHLNGPPDKGKRRPQDNLEKGIFGSANKACSNCEKIPFAIFINNGTDIDRLGENIVQRDLDIGRHNVSIVRNVFQNVKPTLNVFLVETSEINHRIITNNSPKM